jgi:acyl-CoA thioester hydrolase
MVAAPGFLHRLDVRFRDCDAQGHVNNAVFFTYLEQCRLNFWRALTGGSTSPHARVIVARAECDYRAPAFFGDSLEVRLTVGEIGRSSFVLAYAIDNVGSGRRVADAKTVMVTYDYALGRSMPIPSETRELLERFTPADDSQEPPKPPKPSLPHKNKGI